jgi:hypothetical protein
MVMSEDMILSKIFPIHEIFFSDETKHDGIFVRKSYDAAAVITGWRTYELTNAVAAADRRRFAVRDSPWPDESRNTVISATAARAPSAVAVKRTFVSARRSRRMRETSAGACRARGRYEGIRHARRVARSRRGCVHTIAA